MLDNSFYNEFISLSFFARLLSLAIRLFANMMAGHTLLKILTTFFISLIITFNKIFFLLPVSLGLVLSIIFLLEFLIAFLQT